MTTSRTSLRRTLVVAVGLGLALFACELGSPFPTDGTYESEEEFLKVCAATNSDGGFIVTSGIDISDNNGAKFNLRAQKANGIGFVYMKASDGLTSQNPDYVTFRKQAQTLGLAHGAYHFFEPGEDGAAQAQNFLKAIAKGLDGGTGDGGGDCELPPVLDWEITKGVAWSVAEAEAQAFLTAVQAATGQTPMIYTSSAFFPLPVKGSGGLPASFASYPLWVAQYGPTCPNINPPWNGWTIFQFGTANNTLDHDYYNGTLSQLQGLNSCSAADAGTGDGGMDGGAGDGGGPDGGGAKDGGPCLANGSSSKEGNGSDCCSGPELWNADTDVCGQCVPSGQPSACGCGSDCCGGHWPNGVGPNC